MGKYGIIIILPVAIFFLQQQRRRFLGEFLEAAFKKREDGTREREWTSGRTEPFLCRSEISNDKRWNREVNLRTTYLGRAKLEEYITHLGSIGFIQ
jgi:hypothetical protein